jgi:hypothetical protein
MDMDGKNKNGWWWWPSTKVTTLPNDFDESNFGTSFY